MKRIDHYIAKEKQTAPSPFLPNRIIACIEHQEAAKRQPVFLLKNILKTAALTASVALMILLGILVGNNYQPLSQTYEEIVINDSQIEQFSIYIAYGNE